MLRLWRGENRRQDLLALLFFVLLAVIAYLPVLLDLRAFPDGDFTQHFLPFALWQRELLAAGTFPIWNPYTYSGHPFLADVQAAVYYPVSNLLLFLTLGISQIAARLWILQMEAVLHLALAGWFTYLWASAATGRRAAGVFGGVCFAFSGYLTGYPPLQLAVLRTAIWLPLIWWALGSAWQRPQVWRGWIGLGCIVAVAFLAGHSQTFLFIGYGSLFWLACLIGQRRPERWHVVGLVAAAGTTVGLGAAQLLPSSEFVRQSVRAQVDYAFVSGGFPVRDFWQILLPGVLTFFSPLYIGVVGITFALAAVLALAAHAWRAAAVDDGLMPQGQVGWRGGVLTLVLLTGFGLLASLGDNGPLFPLLYRAAPGWSWFRGQERAAILAAWGLSGLAAYGLALLPALHATLRRRLAMVLGAAMVAGVYAFGLLWQLPGHTAMTNGAYLLTAVATLLLGLAAALWIWRRWQPARETQWVVALAIINLAWANMGTIQTAGSAAERTALSPEATVLADAMHNAASSEHLPGRVYNEYRLYGDYGMRLGVEDVWGSSPLRSARYALLFEDFPLDRMWRLLGVEYVLTWRRELFGPSDLLGEFPQAEDTTYLHRLPAAHPRAWLTPEVQAATDEEARQLLADHEFDLAKTALAPPGSPLGANYADAAHEGVFAGAESLMVTRGGSRGAPNTLGVEVTSQDGGMLILSEVWLPGWHVENVRCDRGRGGCPSVDSSGRAFLSPQRVDLTLLGVWIPGGTVQFDLVYWPRSVTIGLWISAATLAVILVSITGRLLSGARWARGTGRGP